MPHLEMSICNIRKKFAVILEENDKSGFGEDTKVKRKTLGFALLLFSNILAIPDVLFFYIGLAIGIIGLCLVISGLNADK